MKKLTTYEMGNCVGGLELTTGLLSPNGSMNVPFSDVAGQAALGGAITAFTQVITNVGLLPNISVTI